MITTIKKHLGLALLHVLAALPQRAVNVLARTSAWSMWRINGRIRKVTERNLAISFPDMSDGERVELARSSIYELNLCIFELGRTWTWSPERLDGEIRTVHGLEFLRAAAAEGHGTVVLFPHLGNWELANIILGKDYSLTTLYRQPKTASFADAIRDTRARRGAKLVPTGSSGVRALLKALKSGEMVTILPDQVPPKSLGQFAPFFGEMTLTMTLATNLIQRTGAKAVSCYCKRLPDGKYELVFHPVDEDIYDPDSATALAGLNKSIERCVMDCPEQYQWNYKRYKFLPNLQKRDYGDSKSRKDDGLRQHEV